MGRCHSGDVLTRGCSRGERQVVENSAMNKVTFIKRL